jgi:molybdenum cofactor biosynthesis enzyme MoaA
MPMTENVESRLLRLDVSSRCNFECPFCCWRSDRHPSERTRPLRPDAYRTVAEAAVRSGCFVMHLTGGEPLALGRRRLSAIVQAICTVSGVRHFYVTTNGSYLDDDYCRMLHDSGLRWLTVSIGAETEEKYRAWARPLDRRIGLRHVLSRIELAVRRGLAVRVHVPLTIGGVSTYEELMILVSQVERVGVREVGFFKLNKTRANAAVFDGLHGHGLHSRIVERFLGDPRWAASERNGYRFFACSNMICDPLLPLLDAARRPRCGQAQPDCGDHCQGTYSAYLRTTAASACFRACHREFDDRRNELPIPERLLQRGDVEGVAEILRRVWGWTASAPDRSPTDPPTSPRVSAG